ncbi:hypothetical protein HYC85_011111 [Camellia sinensis]|uniref:Uncharacterized protein n=1 Tax=Camellia sinensis TaxID=4442 RepID=A0A7J7HL82_CAMSI|nr:hypothetical protein HYC85_011111 [Camellia sinensis]
MQSQLAQNRKNVQQLQQLDCIFLTLCNTVPKFNEIMDSGLDSNLCEAAHPNIRTNLVKNIAAKSVFDIKNVHYSKFQMVFPLIYVILYALHSIKFR